MSQLLVAGDTRVDQYSNNVLDGNPNHFTPVCSINPGQKIIINRESQQNFQYPFKQNSMLN